MANSWIACRETALIANWYQENVQNGSILHRINILYQFLLSTLYGTEQ